jgi:WXXGXW repeat (2 copies)
MKLPLSRSVRLILMALLISLIPASALAGVFISVGFAPPILPVYVQPPCPEPGLMWMPGYWAYGPDGYYWVPGTWVPAPYDGALWTPPYWGWSSGLYVFHPGYWGLHVGYYGGVNYGFGYMGIGFVGGMWRGHDFVYNTAVMHVDRRYVRNTYMDRTIVQRNTIVNDRRVAFSGGPGGIRHDPRPEERFAERDRHMDATSYQHSHESAAMADRSFYARNNGGRPGNAAVARPMGMRQNPAPANRGGYQGRENQNSNTRMQQNQSGGYNNPRSNARNTDNRNTYKPQPGNANNQNRNYNNPRSNGGNPQVRPAPQPESRPAPQQHNDRQQNSDHRDRQH